MWSCTDAKLLSKFAIVSALVSLAACDFSEKKDYSAKDLNDSVLVLTNRYKDTTRFAEALQLMNQAISIDSNYVDSYRKKLFFEESLGRFGEAAKTANGMIRLKPDSAELYFKTGLYRELSGDTPGTRKYFSVSLSLYKAMADTMQNSNQDRNMIPMIYGINLIMLGQGDSLHDFLRENCKTKLDSIVMHVDILGQTKKELLEYMKAKYNYSPTK